MRFLLTLVFLFALAPLHATDATITCTVPTQNSDGSAITAPVGFKLYGADTKALRQTAQPGQPCRFVETNLAPGTRTWYLTAFTATDESAPTNPVSLVVGTTPELTTAATTAYQFKGANLPLALVGITAVGLPCGPQTQILNGTKYCRVSKSVVDLVVWPSDLALQDYWVRAAQ